jgi:hypothetical protein
MFLIDPNLGLLFYAEEPKTDNYLPVLILLDMHK